MAQQCKNCGHNVQQEATFCPACGAQMATVEKATLYQEKQAPLIIRAADSGAAEKKSEPESIHGVPTQPPGTLSAFLPSPNTPAPAKTPRLRLLSGLATRWPVRLPLSSIIFFAICVILLAMASGAAFYVFSYVNSVPNTAVVRTTGIAQAQGTVSAAATMNAQATATQQSGNDSYVFVTQGVSEPHINLSHLSQGQHFTIFFVLRNTGTSTWTDARGYQLTCVQKADNPNCLGASDQIGLNGGMIANGQNAVFTIPIIAPGPGLYESTWQFTHNGTSFAPTRSPHLVIKFTVV